MTRTKHVINIVFYKDMVHLWYPYLHLQFHLHVHHIVELSFGICYPNRTLGHSREGEASRDISLWRGGHGYLSTCGMTGSVVGRTHVQGLWFWSGIPFFVMLACVKLVYYIMMTGDIWETFWKLILLHATVACGFHLVCKSALLTYWFFGTYKPPWMNILGILNYDLNTNLSHNGTLTQKPSCIGNIHSGSETPLPGALKTTHLVRIKTQL